MNFPFNRRTTSIRDGRRWLRKQLKVGADCPLCEQRAQLYRRKITSAMARGLIKQYVSVGKEFAHSAELCRRETHEFSQLSWWGLIDELTERRPDGGKAGWWRINDRGEAFVRNELFVPKYVWVYNGHVVREDKNRFTVISECLTVRFNYSELMTGLG